VKQWGIYRRVEKAVLSGECGRLSSLRWTWLSHAGEPSLLYTGVLAGILDLSRQLAGGKLERLHIEPVNGVPACFALADFEGGIVAEIEIHETLSSSAPDVRFLMADFSGGRITNRPLTGHHHDEGAFLATDAGAEAIWFEPMPSVSEALEDVEIQAVIALALKGEVQ